MAEELVLQADYENNFFECYIKLITLSGLILLD